MLRRAGTCRLFAADNAPVTLGTPEHHMLERARCLPVSTLVECLKQTADALAGREARQQAVLEKFQGLHLASKLRHRNSSMHASPNTWATKGSAGKAKPMTSLGSGIQLDYC